MENVTSDKAARSAPDRAGQALTDIDVAAARIVDLEALIARLTVKAQRYDLEHPCDGLNAPLGNDDNIVGPLTDRQRSDARALYSNMCHLGYSGAEHVISGIAVPAYVNGFKDGRLCRDDDAADSLPPVGEENAVRFAEVVRVIGFVQTEDGPRWSLNLPAPRTSGNTDDAFIAAIDESRRAAHQAG